MSIRRRASWLAVALGAALALALLMVAEPASVLALVRRLTWGWLLVAFGWSCLVLACRGLRLALVSGGRLSPASALAVISVGQFASAALPLRLGEVVLFVLLQLAGLKGAVRGLSFLLLLRALDAAGLLVWALATGIWLGASGMLAVTLAVIVLALVALALIRGLRVPRGVVHRLRRQQGWRRHALYQTLRVRHELRLVGRSPWRVGVVIALSLVAWAGIWGLTVALLRGMGLDWPIRAVLLGVIGASLGAAIPVNAVGSFGTLEAGWTAALAGVGVPASSALAAGFATHLYSLAFGFLACLGGLAYLSLVEAPRAEKPESWRVLLRRIWSRAGSQATARS